MSLQRLDAADLWLLQNDPELAGTSAQALANRRARQAHRPGGALAGEGISDLIDEIPDPTDGLEPDTSALLDCAPRNLQPLLRLRLEYPSASGAELGRMLGISRQAVSKQRRRLLAYLQTWSRLRATWELQQDGLQPESPLEEPNGWDAGGAQ
jgi:hypothetical protein